MKKNSAKWLLLLLISLAALFKIHNDARYQYASTAGDFYSVINPEKTLLSNSYTFRSNLNQGYADNTANLLSNNSSYLLYELVLSKLGISQLVRTYILIFLFSFFGFLNMHTYLSEKYVVGKKSQHAHLFISILYGFSPYFITYIAPGHFLFMILFSFFPLVQLFFERIVISAHNNFALSVKGFAQLSLILLLICISFANLGVFAIFIALMVGQLIIQYVLKQINFKQLVLSAGLFLLACFISNIWWLAPQLSSMTSISAMEIQSRQTIGGSINLATQNSNIVNIISGFPEGTIQDPWLKIFQIALLTLFSVVIFTSLINKHKPDISFLSIVLLTVFFTKGPNDPFGFIFERLYSDISLFQVIRRPASKLYWIIIFYLLTFFFSVIVKNKRKVLSSIFNYLLGFIAILALFVTVQNINLNGFNIPDTYYQAKQYLVKSQVTKVLLLPDLGGSSPEYNEDLNFHKGVDFLSQVWEFKKYIPSSSDWTSNDSERNLINMLAANIYAGQDFCNATRNLNISHVVIRNDLLPVNFDPTLLIKAESALSKSNNIAEIKKFGRSFTIFKIVDDCRSDLISSSQSSSVKYQVINPTKIKITVTSPHSLIDIIYKEKFDKGWVLHAGSIAKPIKSHSVALDYANQWSVNILTLCSKSINLCSYKGGSYSFDLFIEYFPQNLYYLGLFISSSALMTCVVYLIKNSSSQSKK